MVSIGKLARGQASYYLQQAQRRVDRRRSVVSGVEDYYLAGPEPAGTWMGSLARALGLDGRVAERELQLVLEGRSPISGDLLPRRTLRVPGFDVTFSAPKSVSVLFGVADDRVRAEVRQAHEVAVRDAFTYLEREAAMTRRGRDGRELIRGQGLVAAAFLHRTSRAGDPQLHTHILIANLTRSADGAWRALDGRRLYAHARTAGFLYEARLRGELTRRLGVTWRRPRNGIADLEGVPPEVVRAFSRRRSEIEAELARLGHAGAAAAQVAALQTRRGKDYSVTPDQLAPEWRRRAAGLGLDRAEVDASVLGREAAIEGMAASEVERLGARLGSPEGLTETRSVVTRRDALQAWCELMPLGRHMTVDEIEAEVDRLLSSRAFVRLLVPNAVAGGAIRRADGRMVASMPDERHYTTPELLAAEERIIDLACERSHAPTAGASAVAEAVAARPALAPEQSEMVRRVVRDPGRVSVVVGKAGTGKTYALEAARAAWEAEGLSVAGAAVARRAARELEEGSGIVSTSVAALIADLRRGTPFGIPPRSVVVIDEASLLPTRQLREVLEHVVRADAKLVLVGDDRQLPAIQAGGAFIGLARRLGGIELRENRRQVAAWERDALDLLREGRGREAIEVYADNGRLVVAEDADAVRTALVRDWWRDGDVGDAIMIAFRRADVRDLNRRARTFLIAAGRLGTDSLKLRCGEVATGDSVVLRRNDRRRGVVNGDRAVVVAIQPERGAIDIDVNGRRVHLDAAYLSPARGRDGLAHGYAVTGHIAQGMTVDRTLVLGTDTLFQEWGYVAMSRGRLDNRFYAVAGSHERDEFAPRERGRTHVDDIAAALERSRAQVLASDVGWRADLTVMSSGELQRASVRLRQEGAARAEATIRELRQVRAALDERAASSRRPDDGLRDLCEMAEDLERRLDHGGVEAVARVGLIDRELARRRQLEVCGRRLLAPAAMLEAIGPRPERPAELRLWRHRAATLGRSEPAGRQLAR